MRKYQSTNHLPSASAVGVTNNQPKENAIITITATPVATVSPFNFIPDTDVNKRLKVARMAKQFGLTPGVTSSHVGTLQITEPRGAGEDTYTYRKSDLVEVAYTVECESLNKEANQPFTVLKAYFNSDEELYAVLFAPTGDVTTTFHYKPSDSRLLCGAGDKLTVGEVVYDACGGYERNLGRVLNATLGHDGDQLSSATIAIAKNEKEALEQAVHEAKIAAKYAAERSSYAWRSRQVVEVAVHMTRDEYIANRDEVLEAQKQLFTLLERELWDICAKSVGKLRTEVECSGLCDDEADRYDFVTLAEVERFIMKRWATENFAGENVIRDHVAREFIRRHF